MKLKNLSATTLLMLLTAAFCAASGQVLLKIGASGHSTLRDFLNPAILTGVALYCLSSIVWIMTLSRAPLILVYPFTVLTFVLVYVAAIVLLNERYTISGIVGTVIVLLGLYLMFVGQEPPTR
jgi:drug/metabolite transporter (DMT)-like permease